MSSGIFSFVSPKTGQVINIKHARDLGRESDLSPDGRFLAYTVEAQDVVGLRNRYLRHSDARHQTPDHRHAQGQDEREPHLVRGSKWIAYTQHQAKGTDSNIFVAEVATGKSTLLTPHQGEATYTANEFSPDGKRLLITSNAGNGYDNVGLLDIEGKKIDWLTRTNGNRRRPISSRRQIPLPG